MGNTAVRLWEKIAKHLIRIVGDKDRQSDLDGLGQFLFRRI